MKKKKFLSFIIVKDENKEPFNLKISYRLLFFILSLISVIIIGFGLAMFYYYRFYNLHSNYNDILTENLKLKEEKKIISRIIFEFEKMRETDRRINQLFGTDPDKIKRSRPGDDYKSSNAGNENISSYLTGNESISSLYDNLKAIKVDNVNNIPSLFPVDGYITKEFENNMGLSLVGHTGIDIVAKEGSIIRATADGFVVFSGWNSKHGNMIIIDHHNGFISFYKHNKRLLVEEGSLVDKGDSIALLGNSGLSSGPHLHFEIWKDGVPIDPILLVGN